MLDVQLGITVSDALVRIRAYAYATEQSIAAVAHEVAARRLHLGDDGTA